MEDGALLLQGGARDRPGRAAVIAAVRGEDPGLEPEVGGGELVTGAK